MNRPTRNPSRKITSAAPLALAIALATAITAAAADSQNIFVAIQLGDMNAVGAMLKENKKEVIQARMDKGLTALHFAAMLDSTEAVHRLVSAGMSPDVRNDNDKSTPLMYAVSKNATDTARKLLSMGADPTLKASNDFTALHLLARVADADTELVKYLVENRPKSADVNAKNTRGETPLHSAAAAGNIPVIRALLAHGANPNLTNNDGANPHQIAKSDAARNLLTEPEKPRRHISAAEMLELIIGDPATVKNSDGSYYKGGKNSAGKRHGAGIHIFPGNRMCYQGDFANGKREGKGTFIYPNNNSYDGDWLNDVPHGNGVFVFANDGGAINGVWDKGAFIEGHGTFTGNDGVKYSGIWADKKPMTFDAIE